ncbi:MAG: ATP-binding protein [Reichenbachiella sp.]|uniref:ATP-binding protein n=3 Tax=Reichenbachiella sp. TaxID=2184521 RepID=UPI003265A7FC
MRFSLFILSFCILTPLSARCDSWQQALEKKKASLDLRWHTSKPFIQYDTKGNLIGIEYEIVEAFGEYVKQKYQVELGLNWIEEDDFHLILDNVKNSPVKNVFGSSAFSKTKERQRYVNFSDTYLADITVLVSSQGTPIIRNFDEIHQMLQGMQAITIKGTVYETLLLKMKDQVNVDFEISYIDSDDNVLSHISQNDKMFGFIDLPIYLMWIKEGRDLIRQNFFTVRGAGYGFIMPSSSDWYVPFNQFLADQDYKARIDGIIAKYLGEELYLFIDGSYDREQLSTYILTKEKEIQLELIKNANLKFQKEKTYKRILVIGISLTLIFLFCIIYFFQKNKKKTELIIEQKNQIESHEIDIKQKNEQLMNRNAQLLALNEDKNNLVSILAHDLRSPLSNILGLSGLLKDSQSSPEASDNGYLEKISEAANQMNQMIIKILDVGSLERNQNSILNEKVNVNQIVLDLVTRYQPQAMNKTISIEVGLPDHILHLETDHMLLFLILENLLSNAVKFSPSGSTITMEALEKNEQINICVTDQGPGFTEEDKALIFNRFQKLSARPTGDETSTGLGLSIVKKYVTDLGGELWLESEKGKGSTFFVSLKKKNAEFSA